MSTTAPQPDDADRLLRVQQLFVRHVRAIRGYVLCLAPSPADADDVMQDVFLVVTRKADQFRFDTDFVAWACSIARFEVLNHRRRASKQPRAFSPETAEALAAAYRPADDLDHRVELVRTCLDRLSPSARDAIGRRYTDEQPPADIARSLGVKAETVYVTLSKARAALRACIERHLARGTSGA